VSHIEPVAVRKFERRDAHALWLVYYDAIHQTAAGDYSPEQIEAWAPSDFPLDRFTERLILLSPFVAERNGRPVGYADIQPTGYIDHFFVSPTVVRQGVGSLLMQAIHETARASGLPMLYADVSLTARPFFQHWGFVVERPSTLSVRGLELDNFRMNKTLGL
jgi:putative acetyltransferase